MEVESSTLGWSECGVEDMVDRLDQDMEALKHGIIDKALPERSLSMALQTLQARGDSAGVDLVIARAKHWETEAQMLVKTQSMRAGAQSDQEVQPWLTHWIGALKRVRPTTAKNKPSIINCWAK
eukprot:TRINITY_DN2998_c0_g1_i3.p1 TRINITY_DN2998_c0_g1~~TRINITY_DN2998_c0_g1_i3.p1  ORF type:complete len:124 (-),score=24.73 TRINITY_DN2998_c0_g1_i3:279-650(-)